MAEDWETRRYKRKGWPFFGNWFTIDLDEIFKETEKVMEDEFKELSRKAPENLVREKTLYDGTKVKEWGPFVYGYSITIDSDGKPKVKEFGNIKIEREDGRPLLDVTDKREPLVDVITLEKDIKVIAELPGVQKEEIKVKVSENMLTISADTPQRKFFKEIELPAKVEPRKAKSTYNNGILEVTLSKKGEKGSEGVPINIE